MRVILVLTAMLGMSLAFEDKTVFQYLVDTPGYGTLESLLRATGLDNVLTSVGPFTILAPSDFAFSKLGSSVMTSLSKNTAQLKKILEYHVLSEFVLGPQINGNVSKKTVEGQTLTITGMRGQALVFNGKARLNGTGDIICNNGVIQPIDTVLMPPVVDQLDIAQVLLTRDDVFKDVFLAFLLGNLTTILEAGDFTLFAPIDTAFGAYRDNLLRPGNPNNSYIYSEILKYHIIPGERPSTLLRDGPLYTLHGTPVTITNTGNGVKVNQANVIEADIGATNGVIHAIDKLLVPPEFLTGNRRRSIR